MSVQISVSLNIVGQCNDRVNFDFPKSWQLESYKSAQNILTRENASLLVAAALAISIMGVILSTAN